MGLEKFENVLKLKKLKLFLIRRKIGYNYFVSILMRLKEDYMLERYVDFRLWFEMMFIFLISVIYNVIG